MNASTEVGSFMYILHLFRAAQYEAGHSRILPTAADCSADINIPSWYPGGCQSTATTSTACTKHTGVPPPQPTAAAAAITTATSTTAAATTATVQEAVAHDPRRCEQYDVGQSGQILLPRRIQTNRSVPGKLEIKCMCDYSICENTIMTATINERFISLVKHHIMA